MLQELRRLGLQATFFVIGERAAAHPEPLVRALREGHEIELHCMRHVGHAISTREEVEQDTREALTVLRELGARPARWRPPNGVAGWWTEEIAGEHGLRLTGASVDPRDWSGAGVDEMLAAARPDLRAGRVVVMHDAVGPGSSRSDCAATVELLEPLVEEIRSRGLEPAPLGDGPAFWWLRRLPRPSAEIETIIVEEDELRGEWRATAHRLLADQIPRHEAAYRERGWRRIRPVCRAVAHVQGRVIGVVSVFPLQSEPPLLAFGQGDGVVEREWRDAAIGTALMRAATEECNRRGADLIVGDSVTLAGIMQRLGFHRVPRFQIFYERDGACHWHPNWFAWTRDATPLPPRVELAEGDF